MGISVFIFLTYSRTTVDTETSHTLSSYILYVCAAHTLFLQVYFTLYPERCVYVRFKESQRSALLEL